MDLPFAPLSIPAWSDALADVNVDPSRVDEQYWSANDRKYIFPEPGLFLGTNSGRRVKYLLTWRAIELACIHRLISSTAAPLSNQQWQDILVGSLEFKSSDSTCANAQKQACLLLGSAIDDLHLNGMDPEPPPLPLSMTLKLRRCCGVCLSSTLDLSCLRYTSVQDQQGVMQLNMTRLSVMLYNSPRYKQLT